MSDSIASVLSTKIAEKILKQPGRAIKIDEPMISSGLIDSFSLVDLAIIVEDEFNVRIDDSELNKETFDNLDELVKLIESRK